MDINLLSPIEKKALDDFLDLVNQSRRQNAEKMMHQRSALKFLMARKFDVPRSLSLYQSHETVRIREGVVKFDPHTEPLRSELQTGKFTILPAQDKDGSMIALFSAGKHVPATTSQQTTLQGVVYQLDVALDDYDTQRNGIIFIYNMTGSKYSNFDYELSQKILSLLKGAYPARLRKVLIVTAPLWFKAPFRILQLFVREKLRDRVHMVNAGQLPLHVPRDCLPEELGGTYKIDHPTWLSHCLAVHQDDMGDLCPSVPADGRLFSAITGGLNGAAGDGSSLAGSSAGSSANSSPIGTIKKNGGSEHLLNSHLLATSTPLVNGNSPSTVCHLLNTSSSSSPANNNGTLLPEESESEGLSCADLEVYEEMEDDLERNGVSLQEFIENLNMKGKKGLCDEYAFIKTTPPTGTFELARSKVNAAKNRYIDVLCYDHSRVKLPLLDGDPSTDYINANYVEGYRQKRAFISTQGPLTKTFYDFWRMVWHNKCIVLVMTTRTIERCRAKCDQYWPLDEKTYCTVGNFCIINNSVERDKDWVISTLSLANTETNEKRTVVHMQFTSWPDFGVPQSALAMLEFRQKTRDYQKQYLRQIEWSGHPLGPPILVHCSAGIGRTGTFITIDISIQRLEASGVIDIHGTVEKIRSQRAFSIQMPDQYVFCCLALLEFAMCKGLLEAVDLSRFEEEEHSSDADE